MSDLGKKKVSETISSDEESEATREIVLGLPSLNLNVQLVEEEEQANLNVQVVAQEQPAPNVNVQVGAEEDQTLVHEQGVVAAQLLMAARNEAVMTERSEGKKKVRKPRKMKKLSELLGGSSSQGVEIKEPKKKSLDLASPPKEIPTCGICHRRFGSMKAVHGHMRSHTALERNYQDFLPMAPPRPPPPPPFKMLPGFTIPGRGSGFVVYVAGRGRVPDDAVASGSTVAGGSGVADSVAVDSVVAGGSGVGASVAGGSVVAVAVAGGSGQGGEGGRDLGIDLNVDLAEEEDGEEEIVEPEPVPKIDLNMPPEDHDDGDA